MIWFTCKQCGKSHGRTDESAGSVVFCDCGQANRVPWESTAPAPPAPAEEAGAEQAPARSVPPAERPRLRRRPALRRRDPSRCLNHEEDPAANTCAACGEAFCESCVVVFQEQTLCGPCKNYRVARVARPPRVTTLAIISLVLGMVSAPLAFILSLVPLETSPEPSVRGLVCSLGGLIVSLPALVLGLFALRQIESDARVGGRALAMTGTTAAALGVLWCVTVVLLLAGRQMLE